MPMLTVESIRRIKPKPQRVRLADSGARGLYLIVETSGTKRWLFRYQHRTPVKGEFDETGRPKTKDKQHKLALGEFGEAPVGVPLESARRMAAEWRERMKRGEYPHLVLAEARVATEKRIADRAAAPTVETLIDRFRDAYLVVNAKGATAEAKAAKADARLVTAKKWLLDPETGIGSMPLAEVRRKDLNAVLDRVVAAGKPVAAYGLGRLLGQMFRFAVDEELIELSPAERLQKGTMHSPGDRVLSDDEVRTLWTALGSPELSMTTAVREVLRVILVTGARAGEIAAARWEHVKLDGKEPMWTIPATAAKMGRTHLVPLAPLAVAQFKALRALTGDTPFVLPAAERVRGLVRAGERDKMPSASMDPHAIAVAIRRCRKSLGVDEFTAHDLRRTLRTGLSRLGVDGAVAEAVIGHVPRNVLVRTYDLYDRLPERRAALLKWGAHVATVIRPKRPRK